MREFYFFVIRRNVWGKGSMGLFFRERYWFFGGESSFVSGGSYRLFWVRRFVFEC